MSDFVVHKGRRAADGFARHYGATAIGLAFSPGRATRVTLDDGRAGQGSCLGCGHAPCMEKDPSELALPGRLEAYPGDPSLDVCPTRAITWDEERAVATVDPEACIGCGLCVARCPYGAIRLSAEQVADVETNDPNRLINLPAVTGEHSTPKRGGVLAPLAAPAAAALPEAVAALSDSRAALLVRNLLHEAGANARVRRRGDTNMRIDAVGVSSNGRPFVGEIEFSAAVLESPRALLEDVAIMHARYGYAVDEVDPVSLILALPNVRSEYYQVIRDIEKVLGLRCRTITIGALVALLWNFRHLDLDGDAFTTRSDAVDLTASLGIDAKLLVEPYPAAFTPAK